MMQSPVWTLLRSLPFVCMIAVGATLPGEAAPAEQIEPPGNPPALFIESDTPQRLDPPDDPAIIRSRVVEVNLSLLGGRNVAPYTQEPQVSERIVLNLFDDTVITAVLDYTEPNSTGYAWLGRAEDDQLTTVALVIGNNFLVGSVYSPKGSYAIRQIEDDLYVINQIERSLLGRDRVTPVNLSQAELDASATLDAEIASPNNRNTERLDAPYLVDVLVAYTEHAAFEAGGGADMQADINKAVAETNQSFTNSGVLTRINLVFTGEVSNYFESGDADEELISLQNPNDGVHDEVTAWREAYHADLVVLIEEDLGPDLCGQAYDILSQVSTAFAPYAFAVVKRDCLLWELTFGHELGHLMGARHDWGVDGTDNQPYHYNHGYVYLPGAWRTIMAYPDQCLQSEIPIEDCPMINYWSNPDLTYNGIPMGVPDDQLLPANNRRTLNNTAPTVSQFRITGNDFFDNAQLAGTPSGTVLDIYGSTRSDDDPELGCGVGTNYSNSVWYRVNALSTAPLLIDTVGSNYDTVIGVFTGNTLDSLVEVACNDDDGTRPQAKLNFTPVANQTYTIVVGKWGLDAPTSNTILSFIVDWGAADNDLFANARSLFASGIPFYNWQDIRGTSKSPTDPYLSCGLPSPIGYNYSNTVWYSFTNVSDEPITIDTSGSQYDTVVGVFTGTESNLTQVACNDDFAGELQARVTFTPTGLGTTYHIVVAKRGTTPVSLATGLSFRVTWGPPTNDLFANARVAASLPYTNTQPARGSTRSASDPYPSCLPAETGLSNTVWFRHTTTSNLPIQIDTFGTEYDTVMGVYTGSENNLSQIACNDDANNTYQSMVTFTPVSGTTYHIMVAKYGSTALPLNAAGQVTLHITTLTPSNDLIANAIATTVPYSNTQEMLGSTVSDNDPALSCLYSDRLYSNSVWYRFTATSTDPVEINTIGSQIDTVLGVFTGSPGSLAQVACDDDGASLNSKASRLSFTPVNGTTYRIMVAKFGTTPLTTSKSMTINLVWGPRTFTPGCTGTTGNTAALISAITSANSSIADDVINLAAGCTYTVMSTNNSGVDGVNGFPIIGGVPGSGALTINGNGATITRGAVAPAFRFFALGSAANLTLNNLTVTNGATDYGGAIMSRDSILTINNSTFSGNSVTVNGGAIYNNGTLTINGSTFDGNVSGNHGAAVMTYAGTLGINASTFTNNTAGNYAGAIINDGGATTTIEASTFTDNSAVFGGAIFNNVGMTDVISSTFNDNTASIHGGAIYSELNGAVTIQNSTLTGNSATNNNGGAIYNSGTTSIRSSTVVNNTAALNGGGIFRFLGTVTVFQTIVADNIAPSSPDAGGFFTSYGYNLIKNSSGSVGFQNPGDLSDATAQPLFLGALADNGGLTQTIAILPGSVAINAGNPTFIPPPETDQRGPGYPRVLEGRIDIGATESACPTFPMTIAAADTAGLFRAISCANELPTNDVINLTAGSTYTLTAGVNGGDTGLPLILSAAVSGKLTINGNGATIQRNTSAPAFRIFYVQTEGDLTLNNVTVANGNGLTGSGIYNLGIVTLNSSSFTNNRAVVYGGGIYNHSGATLIVSGGTFSNNTAPVALLSTFGSGGAIYNRGSMMISAASIFASNSAFYGGGIYNAQNSAADIVDTVFLGNNASNYGGAIYQDAGTLTIERGGFASNSANYGGAIYLKTGSKATVLQATLSDNTASMFGGGIFALNGSILTISGSTFNSNTAVIHGGGLFSEGIATVVNSTFYLNQALENDGGGIFNSGVTTVLNSTFSGNSANLNGGALFRYVGTLSIHNTLIAGNSAPSAPDLGGQITSLGYNLITSTANVNLIGDMTGNLTDGATTSLILSSLDDHGGPTRTIALLSGSVGINQGDPDFASPPETDQRGTGFPRVALDRLDIGAYENSGASLTVQLTLSGRPAAPNQQWVTSTHVEIVPQGGGAPLEAGDFTSDTYGRFTINFIQPGSYTIRVKVDGGLEQVYTRALTEGSNLLITTTSKSGDANGDDAVTLIDFSLLAASFGKAFGQPGFDARADFNRDSVISLVDFSLLASNFNQAGAP